VGPAETLEGMTKSFLVLSTGQSAATAVPVLATSDASAISAVMTALLDRIVPADELDAPAP